MLAEAAIRALLMQASAVTTLVGSRCYPLQLPQDCPLPALVTEHISTVDASTINSTNPFGLVQSRISVTAIALTYPVVQQMLDVVRVACTFQRGLIGGAQVVSVLRAGVGPAQRDADAELFSQSIDFLVTHHEP
jgi:hypothetical protein